MLRSCVLRAAKRTTLVQPRGTERQPEIFELYGVPTISHTDTFWLFPHVTNAPFHMTFNRETD